MYTKYSDWLKALLRLETGSGGLRSLQSDEPVLPYSRGILAHQGALRLVQAAQGVFLVTHEHNMTF